jgi:hypothetical protein
MRAWWLFVVAGCAETDDPAPCPPPPSPAAGPPFVDATIELGIDGSHHFATDFCELTDTIGGPGVCVFDRDGDGDLDIYFVDRAPYQNLLYDNVGGRFEEIGAMVGAGVMSDSMGCLAFDRDGDGDLDLYITNVGPDQLLDNAGGVFTDVSEETGVAAVTDGFSISATAGDIDGDRDLDLFVARSVKLATCPDECFLFPIACEADTNLLLLNEGGRFVEESAVRGIVAAAPTLATVMVDIDADGDLDIYEGNDMGFAFADRMYLNDGGGHFVDGAVALGLDGVGTDTMGVDVGDYDGDGRSDMVITDFEDRPVRLYHCFDPALPCSNDVAPDSTAYVKWGVGLVDFDHDRDLDLFVASGHVAYLDGDPNYLFFNQGGGRFVVHAPLAEEALAARHVSRGTAFGDLDGDGDIDVVVATAGGRHQVLRNESAAGYSLTVALGSQAVGAMVTVQTEAGALTEHALIGGSYAGSSDPRLHFGMGEACRADVTVRYLSGEERFFPATPAGLLVTD